MTSFRTRIHSPLMGALVVVLGIGAPALLVGACGRTADVDTADAGSDGAAGAAPTSSPRPPAVDASTNADASSVDAGSVPVVLCGDAGPTCPLPPSECLDDHTMRYFTGGTCNDSGTCDYKAYTLQCEPAPMPPDCYQGGCRFMIVR